MELRKVVTIILYTRQQKRHWCIEQSFGLCGRGRGWDYLAEWHWNTCNIIYETSRQSRFDAWYCMLGAGALGWPRGMGWGGRREEGSGWGTHVYLWQIHFDIWQNQYNIVKLKNKIKCILFNTLGSCGGGGGLVAKSCPTLVNLWTPARLLCPWDSPGKNTGEGCQYAYPQFPFKILLVWPYLLSQHLLSSVTHIRLIPPISLLHSNILHSFFEKILHCYHYLEYSFSWFLPNCLLVELSVQIKCIFLRRDMYHIISD